MKSKILLSIITLSFGISACYPPNENEKVKVKVDHEKELLEADRKLLESEKKLLESEKKLLEQEKNTKKYTVPSPQVQENNLTIKRLEQKFLDVSEVYVIVNKTYFHSQPDPSTRQKAFLISGDTGSLTNVRNGFGYIEFYNSNNGKSTNGWIRLNDLEGNTFYGDGEGVEDGV